MGKQKRALVAESAIGQGGDVSMDVDRRMAERMNEQRGDESMQAEQVMRE